MPVARFHPFTATAAQDLGERGAWYTVKQLQPRGQRIEVLTIDSNISTGSFRNATDDSLTYQIKGQEKTVARGVIHRVGLQTVRELEAWAALGGHSGRGRDGR